MRRQLRLLSVAPSALLPGDRKRGLAGVCEICEQPMVKYVRRQRYCSTKCANKRRNLGPKPRACRHCGSAFVRKGPDESNRQHCSIDCSRASAKRSRLEFKHRRPEREPVYRERQRSKGRRDTSLQRLWRKYPWMPRACEACGESRVLDIAHRPEHRRAGAWRTMSNTTPEKIWILCPTHHALLDRLGFTAEQMGIKPREVAA